MPREDGHVKAKTEVRVVRLYAEERQGVLAAPEAERSQEDLPDSLPRDPGPDSRLPASRIVRGQMPVLLSHPVCGHWLQQP